MGGRAVTQGSPGGVCPQSYTLVESIRLTPEENGSSIQEEHLSVRKLPHLHFTSMGWC